MRHAKSDWNADYGADHERPLNDRGVRSARIMGRVLADHDLVPDLIVASTAVRARSTATLANEAGDWRSGIELESSLYGSGTETAIQVAAAAPDVARLMLVGHQPTWSMLVTVLTGERVEMKTATVAAIDFEVEAWRDVATAQGQIVAVFQPRDYLDTEFDQD
ncbi:MAG TPA: histidine phosphatase family protein [Acidimicrobiia bacterium]|nr:histidine phosphatase family protein [Acidimicrobiia bacterium]